MTGATRKTTRLKELILDPKLLVMPGAFDPISARLIQEAGFEAIQCTGFGMTGVHTGLPDYGFLSMGEMVELSRRIAAAVDIPVMADGDTGFGNAVSAWYAVREFERAGCAGVNIEDQQSPKRCGHLEGKSIVPIDEAVAKIRACAEARIDPDFVINARTDALAIGGIDEVVRRGNAYLQAGATMIFIDGMTSRDLAREAVERIRGPVAINVVEGGKSPDAFTFDEMQQMGIARVSLPGTLFGAAIRGMREALAAVRRNGRVGGSDQPITDFREVQALVGFPQVFELERRFLSGLAGGGGPDATR
jgi:2-methylisocitrate lyase-like PEP mutase family enzyme